MTASEWIEESPGIYKHAGSINQRKATPGFSKELLDKQSEVAEKLNAITSDPVVLARAERFRRKVRLSAVHLLRRLGTRHTSSDSLRRRAGDCE